MRSTWWTRVHALADYVRKRESRDILFLRVPPRPSPHSSIFPSFLPSSLVGRRLFLKERLTDAPSAGAPFHHTPNPLLAPSSFIPPESPLNPSTPPPHNKSGILETLRNALKHCYLIVVMKASTVSSNKRSPTAPVLPPPHSFRLSPFRRERERLWLPFSARQPISHTVAGWSTSNYFMPLGSACAGRCGVALEKNEDDWQASPIPQELIRLPD